MVQLFYKRQTVSIASIQFELNLMKIFDKLFTLWVGALGGRSGGGAVTHLSPVRLCCHLLVTESAVRVDM